MSFGLDYSDARPSHAAMKTAGVRFVMRYIGSANHTASRHPKFLTPAEAASLHKDGFDLGVVFETEAARADGGRGAGLADAHLAVAELAYCGLPADTAIYFAVDYDAVVGEKITAYFDATKEVIGLTRNGAYGGFRVVQALRDKGLIGRSWQTYAWSWNSAKQQTDWDPRNDMEQYSNNRRVGGADVDFNRSMKTDFGQWPASGQKPQEEDMAYAGVPPIVVGERHSHSCRKGSINGWGIWFDSPNRLTYRLAAHSAGGRGDIEKELTVGGPTSSSDSWPKKPSWGTSLTDVDAFSIELVKIEGPDVDKDPSWTPDKPDVNGKIVRPGWDASHSA